MKDIRFSKLMNRCKNTIHLNVNSHKGFYQTLDKYLDDLKILGIDEEDISVEMRDKMIELDTIIQLDLYPDTAIGSYTIYDCDYDSALDRALVCLNIKD